MSGFYLQSGWGHHTRMQALIEAGARLAGVILSPQHLTEGRIEEAAQYVPGEALLDPQSYVHSIPDGQAARHEDHGLEPAIAVDASARELSETVEQVLALNERLGIGRIISPSPLMSGFLDPWSQLGASLLSTCAEMARGRGILATVAVDSAAFSSWEDVELWLDLFTRRDVDGVYLIVANESGYPPAWDVEHLVGVLRFIYRLSILNDYEVIWGYSDIVGLTGMAAGASGMASGWFYGQRRFSRNVWVPSGGGRQPTPRVMLPALLAAVRADAVSPAWQDVGAFEGLDPQSVRRVLSHMWEGSDAWQQHLMELAAFASELADLSQEDRLSVLLDRLEEAQDRLEMLEAAGVALEAGLRARVGELATALARFVEMEL